jgi:hypothetical protein
VLQTIRQTVKRSDVDRANNNFAKASEMLYDIKQLPRALGLLNDSISVRPKMAQWYATRAMVHR